MLLALFSTIQVSAFNNWSFWTG